MIQTVFLTQGLGSGCSSVTDVKPLKFALLSPDWDNTEFSHFLCKACLLNGGKDLMIELKDLKTVINHIKKHKKQKHIVKLDMLHRLMKALEDDFVWKD